MAGFASVIGSVTGLLGEASCSPPGLPDPLPRFEPGRLAAGLRRNEDRDEFVRARSRAEADALVLEPVVGQESHMIVRSGAADALIHVPRGNGELVAGSSVQWLRLGDG